MTLSKAPKFHLLYNNGKHKNIQLAFNEKPWNYASVREIIDNSARVILQALKKRIHTCAYKWKAWTKAANNQVA